MTELWNTIPYTTERDGWDSRLKTYAECLVVDMERSHHHSVLEDCNELIAVLEGIREIAVKGIADFNDKKYKQEVNYDKNS